MKARDWQSANLAEFLRWREETGEKNYTFEACPGAGKSWMLADMAWNMKYPPSLSEEDRLFNVDWVLVLVPWNSIQTGMLRTFGNRGLDVTDRLFIRSSRLVEQPVPTLDGCVTTYAEAANNEGIELLRKWKKQGLNFAVAFDEVQHTSERSDSSWGEACEIIQNLADASIVMSGTFFRSDKQRIKCVEYNSPPNEDQVRTHFAYPYSQGLADQVVRQVSFREFNASVDMYDRKKDERYSMMLADITDQRGMAAASKEVFHRDSDVIHQMITEADEDLNRLRYQFPNAGMLWTCRPGNSEAGDTRHVHELASKIRQFTGEDPMVVTHQDRSAQGTVDAYRNSDAKYLVAINMISEGVDIPRLRQVGIARNIQSEMQFRQLVGRALRFDENGPNCRAIGDTARVYLPKFNKMHLFARNMEREAMEGLKDLTCDKCNMYPCVCPCEVCNQQPCICPPTGPPPPPEPSLTAVGVEMEEGGGVQSGFDVMECFIRAALRLITDKQTTYLSHHSKVELGSALQQYEQQRNAGNKEKPSYDPVEERQRLRSKVNRAMQRLAFVKYGGDFGKCWHENLRLRHGVEWKVVLATWTIPQLRALLIELNDSITEAYKQ